MAKSLFEELGGKYERQGDYLIPCLTVPAEEEQAIGIWGQRHLDYLKQYRKVTYTNLLTSGRLNAYLADINRQAQERFERLIEGMKQAQGITEQLKAENALEWTGCLNNIRACARDVIKISEKEKIKITEMCVPTNGELCSSDTACSGDIVILPNDVLQLNSILGNEMLLPQRTFIENPLPMLQTTIAAKKSEQREILLGALTEISDGDPLLKYYVDTTTHEIILSFLGNVQMEVICAILEEKYHVEAEIKEPTVIYMERPLRKAEYTIHIEVPPNPFWASVGLSIEPLPIGSGVQYESRVSLGYLNQSFQNAVMEGVLYGCEQGLYGWKVTDCKICFEYGLYYSPVSTPADFRLLSPIVLEQALKKAGTELLEPYLHFEIYAPQEYLSRAYHDAPRYCADIVSTQIKNDEVILKGEIPARCIQEYRNDLTYFTNGQGVCLTELKGYQPAIGKFICQPRRPNSRIDKVRHMFHKLA